MQSPHYARYQDLVAESQQYAMENPRKWATLADAEDVLASHYDWLATQEPYRASRLQARARMERETAARWRKDPQACAYAYVGRTACRLGPSLFDSLAGGN